MITLQNIDPQMIANNLEPYEPTHPGEIIKDEIDYRGISQRKLSSELGISYSVFNEILNGKRPLNVRLALMIEAVLGIESDMLLRIQSEYDMLIAKQNKEFMLKISHLAQSQHLIFKKRAVRV